MMARVNRAGEELVKEFEQFREFAYPDPASPLAKATHHLRLAWGMKPAVQILNNIDAKLAVLSGTPWTVGYGETVGTTLASRMSEPQALTQLRSEIFKLADQILDVCTITPNENELAGMTSMAYNVGMGWRGAAKPRGAKDGFRQSSVLRAHNRGDAAAASRAFSFWNKAGGKEMPGLVRRRAAEASLYLRPAQEDRLYTSMPDPLSPEADKPWLDPSTIPEIGQVVDAESSMSESPVNRASVVAGGTTALALTAETARTVGDVKYSMDGLGEWLVPILLVAVIGLCGYLIWQRVKQRKGGWA